LVLAFLSLTSAFLATLGFALFVFLVFALRFAVIPTPVIVSRMGLENTQLPMLFQTVSPPGSVENH
jgi:hypothetical protein